MTSGAPPSRPTRVLRAELRCHLCAETIAAVEAETSVAMMPAVAHVYPTDGSPARERAWRGLHCSRCGSTSLYLDEPQTIVRRDEQLDWTLERPRRGRPPRWLRREET
jgi:hypothetical protein